MLIVPAWSRGMIPASGAGGPGFESRSEPFATLIVKRAPLVATPTPLQHINHFSCWSWDVVSFDGVLEELCLQDVHEYSLVILLVECRVLQQEEELLVY